MTKEDKYLTFKEQENIRQKVNRLHWLVERFGDKAKYQGHNQGEILGQLIRTAILLRLIITVAKER